MTVLTAVAGELSAHDDVVSAAARAQFGVTCKLPDQFLRPWLHLASVRIDNNVVQVDADVVVVLAEHKADAIVAALDPSVARLLE